MKVSFRGRNGAVPAPFKQYAEKRVQRLQRYFRDVQSVQIEQGLERGQHIVELSIAGDSILLRSQERSGDLNAAVDGVVAKLERQVQRFKTRVRRSRQRPGPVKAIGVAKAAAEGSDTIADETPAGIHITRRKRFLMKPMPAEEAARQMELVDHDFFLFVNEETGEVNVLYRRRDGDYGLIEPER